MPTIIEVICIVLFCMWLDYKRRQATTKQIKEAFEGVLDDIETRRAERELADAELCVWLLKWKDGMRDDMQTMNALVEEFREIMDPYTVPDDGTQN